ncbi:MAG: pyrimidine dimer DNA glycosylase/endonuclease V [Arthrobacter sp.]|uniref:pyrimidine dimer DNA glycosylase/endonuclease V n=1 Tax=Arthrobacter sp. TaxID=1667 RepID=UPI00347AF5BE
MRIWSLHPRYLDAKGLVACWRETLLAQKVLRGGTSGYRNHPQLRRFRAAPDPVAAIGAYLDAVEREAAARGYGFNRALIVVPPHRGADDPPGIAVPILDVTRGQLAYETEHLAAKLAVRDPTRLPALAAGPPAPHPLFRAVDGPVEEWEIVG